MSGLLALVERAALAPSSHNSQPWRFRLGDGTVELRADRSRALPVVDPHDRELTISVGAALECLCVAARAGGIDPRVTLLPDREDPDLIARAALEPGRAATPEERLLDAAMERRHTWRRPFEPRPLAPELIVRLQDVARAAGARLQVTPVPHLRERVAELVMEGDRRQMRDPAFRRELAGWLRPTYAARGDGMPGEALGMGAVTARAAPLVIRTFDLGRGQAARDHDLAVGSPLLAMLATPDDTVRDWIAAGRALARLLLTAAAEGVQASYLNQPIEVPELRPQLGRLLDGPAMPQMLLRMGYAPAARGAPRRNVEEVVEVSSPAGPG